MSGVLDWLNSNGVWIEQTGAASDVIDGPPWGVYTTTHHGCAKGQVHYWRTRGEGEVVQNDVYYHTAQFGHEAGAACLT